MLGAMIRAAERWRAIRITDFKRRQMTAVRQELDQKYEARNDLDKKAAAKEPRQIYPAVPELDPQGSLLYLLSPRQSKDRLWRTSPLRMAVWNASSR